MELDTGFRPSEHGFSFPNTWHDTLFGVVASRGRCGGMVFAALDAFAAGTSLPGASHEHSLPAHDSALARWIWRRQMDSVLMPPGENALKFARFTYLPTTHLLGIGPATRRELLGLFDLLRSGRPVPLGLVSALGLPHIARNHQVLAYAAEFGEDAALVRVYDPNHPLRDDITIEVPLEITPDVVEHIGGRAKRWRGFFVEDYAPRPPLGGPAVSASQSGR
ncbi:MAG: hypothetical protein U1E08_02315 [Coriobacteriia bacterium]|nr:hypothetical protein [Coriobacteriia bacterium]